MMSTKKVRPVARWERIAARVVVTIGAMMLGSAVGIAYEPHWTTVREFLFTGGIALFSVGAMASWIHREIDKEITQTGKE